MSYFFNLKFNNNEYTKLKGELEKSLKRITVYETSGRTYPTDKQRIEDYKIQLVTDFNKILTYVKLHFDEFNSERKTEFEQKFLKFQETFQTCLGILGLQCTLPTLFNEINIEDIVEATAKSSTNINNTTGSDLNERQGENNSEQSQIGISNQGNQSQVFTMTELADFLKTASAILKNSFSGDPMEMESFIAAMELADTMATAAQKPTLIKLIKTKLNGKALEIFPEAPADIGAIGDAFRAKIKHDNSKIISGRMMALRVDKQSMQTFAKTAEELSDALRRAYISEGMSREKAIEMSTDKTIEMCRINAKTELVRSVLASAKFDEPKDVVAKYIVEATTETKERQIFAFNASRGHNNYRGRGNNNLRGRGNNNFNNYNNGQRRYNNYNNNYNNNGYNNNNRGNYRGNNRGYFRGRGRNNNNNNNDRYVRVMVQENGQALLGEQGQNQQQPRQAGVTLINAQR